MTGGANVDLSSDGFEVLGSYKIWSYGIWKGTVILERENPNVAEDSPIRWEALRQWRGNNDRNVAEEGLAEFPQKLRLRVVDGTGTSSADVDRPRFVVEADDAKIFGVVRIVSVTSETVVLATIVRPVFSRDVTRNWNEGAWSDFRGYPSAITIHNQRLIFAGTANQPQTIWSSATADLMNFRRGLNDADGFSRTLAADDSSPIIWAQSLGAGIIIGKENSEWLAAASEGQQSMTPTNFQAKKQSAYGSSATDPVIVGPRILFVKFGGKSILEYVYSYDQQAFSALDMSEGAEHLFRGEIKQMAFSRNPDDTVYIVTHDGRMATMHYNKEKQFIAYARHKTDAFYESVAVVNGPGDVDHVYVAVKRTLSGNTVRFIERIDLDTLLTLDSEDIDEVATRSQLCYLDSAVRAEGSFTTTAGGFGHLEGETIAIWADGSRHASKVVTGGAVALDRAASVVLGGIDYSDTTVMSVFPADLTQPPGTTYGKKLKVGEISARVYNSTAFRYADSLTTEVWDAKILEATNDVNTIHPMKTGLVRCCAAPRWQDELKSTVLATGAEPFNLLALSADLEVSGA